MSPSQRHAQALAAGDTASRRFDPAKFVQVRDDWTEVIFTKDRATGQIVEGSGPAAGASQAIDPRHRRREVQGAFHR